MRSVSLRLCDLQKSVIPIGYVDENLHTQVRFDCKKIFEEYPSAIPSLAVCPPAGETYPAIVTREGDFVIWDVTASDVITDGAGEIQLTFVEDEVVAKSYICRIRVNRSLEASATAPEPIENWVTRANIVLAEIPQTITESIDEAFGTITAEASTLTPGSQATAAFDSETKVLSIGVPEGLSGEDGYSPVRGVDYWTAADQQAMREDIATDLAAAQAAIAGDKADALTAIGSAGTTQVGNVNTAGTTQVGNVNTAGVTQVGAVQAKGVEVIASIPSDYSELSADVSDLKNALSYDKNMMIATDKSEITTTWAQGRLDGGSNYHIRSGYINISKGDIIGVNDIKYAFKVGFYNSSGTMTSITNLTNLYVADNNYRVRIQMQNVNELLSILPEEGDNCVFTRNVIDAVSKIPTLETKTSELYTLSDLLALNGSYSFPASFYARGRYVSGYPAYDITYRAVMPNVIRLGYDVVITPVDNSFRVQVLLYNESDVFVSIEEITSAKSVPKNQGFRLSILRRQESTSEIADLYEFARAVEVSSFMTSSATGEKYVLQTVPFAEYKIDAKLYKMKNSYVSFINPRDNFIRIANGVTVYMAVNGDDTNDGLSSAHPKKTFASAAAVQNVQTIILAEGTYEAGTHFTNGEQITIPVNLIGVGNVIIKNGHFSAPITFTNSLYCENITFYWGNNAIIVQYDSYDKIATFYKCKFEKSGINNGLYALGGLTYVIECEATNNASDGFNYHKNSSILNHAIEIDCKSSFNGDGNNYSSNATTTHNGNYIVRVNGDYKCCYGGVVADQEAYSANYGCSTGISTITDAVNYADRMSNYWASSATMYLYDCVSYGSKYDTATIGTGSIISNVVYSSNYTE